MLWLTEKALLTNEHRIEEFKRLGEVYELPVFFVDDFTDSRSTLFLKRDRYVEYFKVILMCILIFVIVWKL